MLALTHIGGNCPKSVRRALNASNGLVAQYLSSRVFLIAPSVYLGPRRVFLKFQTGQDDIGQFALLCMPLATKREAGAPGQFFWGGLRESRYQEPGFRIQGIRSRAFVADRPLTPTLSPEYRGEGVSRS